MMLGCAGGSTSSELIAYARKIGTYKPYRNQLVIGHNDGNTFDRVIAAVQELGGRILIADRAAGVVSWVDTGYSFHLPPSVKTRFVQKRESLAGQTALSTWHGFVQAAARIKEGNRHDYVYVRAVARDETNDHIYCSDGHFEGRFVDRCRQVSIAQAAPAEESQPWPFAEAAWSATQPSSVSAYENRGYWDLYYRHFRNMPSISGDGIFTCGFKQVIPASRDEAWEACLDLVWQYDGIAWLDSDDRTVAFCRSQAWVDREAKRDDKAVVFCDVLLAVTVRKTAGGGSQIAVVWLDPRTMTWQPTGLPKIKPDSLAREAKKRETASLSHARREETAKALTSRFVSELAVQMSWKDRLLRKLQDPETP